jgi:hypothetical protein
MSKPDKKDKKLKKSKTKDVKEEVRHAHGLREESSSITLSAVEAYARPYSCLDEELIIGPGITLNRPHLRRRLFTVGNQI